MTDDARLRALCDAATPGKREQMAGKYMSFDYGETPQVFRSISDADEALIIACDPATIRSLLDAKERMQRTNLELVELAKGLEAERDALRAAAEQAREALRLVQRIQNGAEVQRIYESAFAHGAIYRGETWEKEVPAALAALDKALEGSDAAD